MKHVRWFVFPILMLVLVACASAPEPTATPEPTPDDILRIGLVVGTGGVDDGGFNQLALAGVTNVSRRLGAELEYVVPGVDANRAELESMAESGLYEIIVTVSFEMTDITREVAASFPDVHFVGIDQFQLETLPNVTGILFPEDQAGYLAGFLAASLSETGIVGGVYGPESVGPVAAFARGYEVGAVAANPGVEVLTVFHPGGVDVAFSDIPWGQEQGDAQLDAGADVVFAAAGDTGRGALIAVANRTQDVEGQLYCIGVDTDQWLTAQQARPCLVSSAVKAIPQAVDDVIAQVVDGVPPSGNYFGPAGLAPFHDFEDDVPDALQTRLQALEDDLTAGVITVEDTSE
ncbi:MAG: BMP family ABC transporter substrate-binding protein [Chloroflexota bacterium]